MGHILQSGHSHPSAVSPLPCACCPLPSHCLTRARRTWRRRRQQVPGDTRSPRGRGDQLRGQLGACRCTGGRRERLAPRPSKRSVGARLLGCPPDIETNSTLGSGRVVLSSRVLCGPELDQSHPPPAGERPTRSPTPRRRPAHGPTRNDACCGCVWQGAKNLYLIAVKGIKGRLNRLPAAGT